MRVEICSNLDTWADVPKDRARLADSIGRSYTGFMPARYWRVLANAVLASVSGRIVTHALTLSWGYPCDDNGYPLADTPRHLIIDY